MAQKTLVPPDGGWGWMIVVAYSLNWSMAIPLMQLFGLLFGDKLKDIGLTATDTSVIINTNQAFGMLLGLVNGALLKKHGYRKVAFIGSFCIFVGVIATAFANSFSAFLITYGIIYSFGCGMGTSAFSLALNTYFLEKRSKATSYALSISGLAPIIMPQLVTFLVKCYGLQGAVLIFGAITGNSLVAAALLQPVKFHLKELDDPETTIEEIPTEQPIEKLNERRASQIHRLQRKISMTKSTLSIDHDVESSSIYGFDTQNLNISMTSLPKDSKPGRKQSVYGSYASLASVDEENVGVKIGEGKLEFLCEKDEEDKEKEEVEDEKKKAVLSNCFRIIADLFDLSLLGDPIYVNIMLGMSIAIFSELNFSMLTPLMLADFGLNSGQAATFMSVLGIADLIFRLMSPYIGDYLKKTPRIMYMISLIFLVITRFFFISARGFYLLLVSAVSLGFAKGLRTIYMYLVIPSYVPLDKLPGASGIQMVTNGLFFIVGGPFLGFIKDFTGTYRKCVVFMNFMTLLTIAMWALEMLIVKRRSSKKSEGL